MIGTPVYKGIGIGKAFNFKVVDLIIPSNTINSNQIEETIVSFENFVLDREAEITKQMEFVKETVGVEESLILLAHIEILNDPELKSRVIENVKKQMNLVASIDEAKNFFVNLFLQIEDTYIKERAKDIEDVLTGLIKKLLGIKSFSFQELSEDTIIFAKDLNPSDTVSLNDFVKGIVLTDGSQTSHTAIVAKAKGIPTLVGYSNGKVEDNADVIIDTKNVNMWINPSEDIKASYLALVEEEKKHKKQLETLKDKPAVTKDNYEIKLFGNVGSLEDTKNVVKQGGFGVGLLRTELVYMESKDWPTVEEQYNIYSKICGEINQEVIIRTLDIGGDKMLPYYTFESEENPFLGLRAIRFCLKNKEIFKTQLKAILKASANYPVKVMFPMIGSLQELLDAKAELEIAKQELDAEGTLYNKEIPVGIMVEIPAAVFAIDLLAEHVDFVSIGTNDLCQYTLAVDRLNAEVSYLYDSMNVSILRMIHHVVKVCKPLHVEVGICGEMASDLDAAKVLIGLGVDELSVSPIMIPLIKEMMQTETISDLEALAKTFI